MKRTGALLAATVPAIMMALLATGCLFASDDDNDDGQSADVAAECVTFCERIVFCEMQEMIGALSTEECYSKCDEISPDIGNCVLNAQGCDAARECFDAGDDDINDDSDDDLNDDTGDDDTHGDDDTSPPPPDAFQCSDLGLPVRQFIDADVDRSLYATAADFTAPTLRHGDWNLKDKWTGCETYLVIPDKPKQCEGWSRELWSRDVNDLLEMLPANVRVLFVAQDSDESERLDALYALKEQVDEYVAQQSADAQDRWHHRIIYVTQQAREIEGWLGPMLYSPKWGYGIDRFQRIRYIGSFADYSRYDSGMGWFAPNLSMAANESIYYNFEFERDQAMEAENATVINIFPGEAFSGTQYVDIELPDAETMSTFDTMSFDLYLGCDGSGEFGTCPAWDYLVYLYLCDADDPENCGTEFGRWITTYHREGRWVHDVSGLLPLIAEGGTRRFGFETSQTYEVKLDLRLSTQSKPSRAQESTYLFTGGAFNADYNEQFTPIDVWIPADAVKVELATVITGHGMSETGNCAEFCNTTHHFFVNGNENVLDFPYIGNNEGCMDQVTDGTVPNQYGTWWYGRSGWCPGKDVPVVMTDVTSQVNFSDDNTFDYEGYYQGEPFPDGGATIRMRSWVVVSK